MSHYHAEHPYVFRVHGEEYRVHYLPAESNTGMFGGNSYWRGPIWMPVNAMLIRALPQYYLYYGDNFKVECPTGSSKLMNLFEVSREISTRLQRIFLRDERSRRPVYRFPLEGSPAVARVLPRRQRGRPGGQPSDGLDGVGREAHPALRAERSLNLGFLRARTREKHTRRARCKFGKPPTLSRSCDQRCCLPFCLPTRLEELSTMPPNSDSENEAKLLLQNPSKQVQRQP